MNKLTDSIIQKTGTLLSKTALTAALTTSNATCWYTTYQPSQPKKLEKFKK